MQVVNQKEYDDWKTNNIDPYGRGIFSYAERWANLMEVKIDGGEKLEEIAQTISSQADTEGISGFMYGAAVEILSKCWIHGESLRKWHNLDCQLQDEGEKANDKDGAVLNPALLRVEKS